MHVAARADGNFCELLSDCAIDPKSRRRKIFGPDVKISVGKFSGNVRRHRLAERSAVKLSFTISAMALSLVAFLALRRLDRKPITGLGCREVRR